MKKNFREWHTQKTDLQENKARVFFHEGEIWWSALGANIGYEQDGKNDGFERPVLVFKKFNNEIFWGLPITSKKKDGKYYFNYRYDETDFSIILSQIRLMDAKRLKRKIRALSKEEYSQVKDSFKILIK